MNSTRFLLPKFLNAFVYAALIAPAVLIGMAAEAPQSESANPPPTPAAALKTQDFESGEKKMAEVGADALERFLQDLNQRKDWDYACHNGQPGPDAAYLFKWVVRTTSELQSRGYYFDAAGQLHRPGAVVPVR